MKMFMRAPFTNTLLLIDNDVTNIKQNTFLDHLFFLICQSHVLGDQHLQVK